MTECQKCGKCCKYVVIDLDTPEDKDDWEEIRWFLCHKNVVVFYDEEDDTWAVEFRTQCKYQDENNICTIYEKRPETCRDHDPEECETCGEGEEYDILFETVEDVDEFLENNPDMLKESSEEA